jgi:N-acetylgalactosamine-N,N'-diacetylbacillosaminyl-diphospho-undecaprenol 4-alpha-N-acetylgalactosaminyltransferase
MSDCKKKITVLTLGMSSGGAERVISLIVPLLIKQYDVTLILFNNVIHYDLPIGLKIYILNNGNQQSFLCKIFSFPILIYKFIMFLKKNSVGVSISFLTRPNLINGIGKIFCPKTKVIISERCFPSIAYKSFKLRYYLYKFLIPFLYNKADILFSNSIYINNDLKTNFNLKIPSFVIYNPVNIVEHQKLEDKDDDILHIIHVGSMSLIKKQDLIIQALSICKCLYRMTFVGDGVMMNTLKEISHQLKLENIDFAGRCSDVNSFLLKNDCFILSSKSEGFPNVILEAMACGLTVISTNCMSGPLEILNENNEVFIPEKKFVIVKYGILVNVDDKIGLASAIDFVASNKKFREQMREAVLKRIQQYKLEKIFSELSLIIDI